MKSLFIGLFVIMLAVLGVVNLVETDSSDSPEKRTPTSTPPKEDVPDMNNGNEEVAIPSEFRHHVETESLYRLAIPYSADVSNPQTGITRYRHVGPENEPNTEITDGYIVTIEAQTTNTTSLETLVNEKIENNTTTVIEQPEHVTIAGKDASRYVTESVMGSKSITHYILLPGNGYEYTVSVNLSPADNEVYKTTTTRILNTLQFFDESIATSLRSRIVPIAMLDYGAVGNDYIRESTGKERGCDKVVLIDHVLTQSTTTPLHASLEQLFAYKQDIVGGWQNFIASQNQTLSFSRAEIIGTTAKIYLIGELGPLGGVCDNPRTAIQIEETALAYSSVDTVELYLNNELTNLTPSGRGD